VKMTPIKSGRSIAAVRFDWHWKDPQEATEIVAENERHSAARKKDQADSAAPPMIEDTPQPTDALTWWNGLTDTERAIWFQRLGPDELDGPGGLKFSARRPQNIATEAYALFLKGAP
jgi:hypothetical protein